MGLRLLVHNFLSNDPMKLNVLYDLFSTLPDIFLSLKTYLQKDILDLHRRCFVVDNAKFLFCRKSFSLKEMTCHPLYRIHLFVQ